MLFIHWNPNPWFIHWSFISIRYYGILFVTGLLLSLAILTKIYEREKIPTQQLNKLSVYCLIGIIAGARLGHCLFYEPSYFLAHPLEIILPVSFTPDGGIKFTGYQGLASHGGALGLLIALYLYSRKTKHSMLNALDLLAIVAPLAGGCIRLGNFMNSEIIGKPSSLPWSVIFERIDQVPRHPTQLYEAICYFLIAAIMLVSYKKHKFQPGKGFYLGIALVFLFTARFFIEFLKENQVQFENKMILNMGQLLSLPYIILGILLIGYSVINIQHSNKIKSEKI